MTDFTEHDKMIARHVALINERASWMAHWKDISSFLLPRAGRYFSSDRNLGAKRTNNIYDSTGTQALRILAAGLMGGMTSPARPWFRLATRDTDLMKSAAVKQWLNDVSQILRDVFARSNTYRALHSSYEELGAFGTSATVILGDFDTVIHQHPITAGEYCISTDGKGRPDTMYREFQMQVGALVKEFGEANLSRTVKNLYDNRRFDTWIDVLHIAEPRMDRDYGKRDGRNKPWKSIYLEKSGDKEKQLRVAGYDRFRAVTPRWSLSGGDIYGTSPGMDALGDVKQLQHEQLRKAVAIDYQTDPPLQAPSSLEGKEINSLPGGVTYVDSPSPGQAISSMFNVNLDLNHLLADIQDVRARIKGTFHADLFLMLANQSNTRMTATEVAERHEEKLLMLGPVLERLHNEQLDPMIDIAFEEVLRAGIAPPPPPELQNADLQVEYVSMLAQAQRAVGINSIERFVTGVGQIAMVKPEALDKIDADSYVDIVSDLYGVDPSLVVPGDKVMLIRKARAEQAQKAQDAADAEQKARMAKDLSSAKTGDANLLTEATQQFAGYN